jgi:hypothetical protein
MKNILIDSNVLFYWDDPNGQFYKYTKHIFDLQEQWKTKIFAWEFTRVDTYKNIITSEDFTEKTPKLFDSKIIKMFDMCFLEYNYIKILELKYNTTDWKTLDHIIFNTDDGLVEFMPWITYREFIRLSFILEDKQYWINISWTDNAIVLDMIYWNISYNFDYFVSNDQKLIKSLNRAKKDNLILWSEWAKIFWDNMKFIIKRAFDNIEFIWLVNFYNIKD